VTSPSSISINSSSSSNSNISNMDVIMKMRSYKASQSMREFLAETMGTIVLIMIGIGCEAQSMLSKGHLGGFLSINIGAALGVTFGIYWSVGISGGHLNPAVTLAMVLAGRLPARKMPVYWCGQALGTFIASGLCFFIYKDLLDLSDGGTRTIETAGIWTTYPKKGVTHTTVFIDQIVGTGLLVGAEFSLTDKSSKTTKASFMPAVAGLLVLAIGTSFGTNCGYGINPTRDLIPRIFTSVAGWKEAPFKFGDYYFWIPILGQVSGAIVGALAYMITIEMHHPENKDTEINILKNKKILPTLPPIAPADGTPPKAHVKIVPTKSLPPDIVIDIGPAFVYDNPIATESAI